MIISECDKVKAQNSRALANSLGSETIVSKLIIIALKYPPHIVTISILTANF